MFRKFFSATLGIGFALIVLTVVAYSLYAGGIYAVLKYENKQTVQVQGAVEGVPPDVEVVPDSVGTTFTYDALGRLQHN